MLLSTIEFDECTLLITQVKLEKDTVFGIGGSTGGKGQFAGVLLDSKNKTFTVGNESGPAAFAVGAFHKVEVALTEAGVSATLDGKALGKSTKGIGDGFFIEMSLDRYVMADVDNFQLTA